MESVNQIQETLSASKYLVFYKIMKYPIPTNMEYFFFEKKINKNLTNKSGFSRNEKNKNMDEYINFINKYGKLYQSIPFIKEIYLCNSISFNALKKDSDIDLFIITNKNSIRRARFFSLLFFFILGLKRGRNIRKKFCLSFYVTQDHQNLYSINLSSSDIYLNYWLAHLIPLYQEQLNSSNIYKKNKRFNVTMPNHPKKFCINIGNKIYHGKSKIKKNLEFIFGGLFGKILEFTIGSIWIPILSFKTKKLGKKGQGIIINNNMLKFHEDKRAKIHLIYEIEHKNYR
ncbi:MAG: hypothetical protein WAZ12_04450 [Candidatus Absconditicoccaceae bacterium]